MKKILNFLENLQFLFKPKYWIMLGKYDREWDIKINELASNGKKNNMVNILC